MAVEAEPDPGCARTLCPGERFRAPGVLLACEPGDEALRGLRVSVSGEAIERGLVRVARARARPFSARLAPWEASGWEHALEFDARTASWACVLRGARVPPAAPGSSAAAARAREALLRTVWVEVEGSALAPGEGALELEVCALGENAADRAGGGAVRARSRVRVRAEIPPEVWSAYIAFDAPPGACGGAVRAALDALARWISSLPRGARAVWAHGSAPGRATLRAGCAVLGPEGLAGDRRFRELSRRLRAGALDRLWLCPPGASRTARARDEVLDLFAVHAGRFAPAAVEVALSIGAAQLDDEAEDAVARLVRCVEGLCADARVVHAFVAAHGWVPSLLDATPWERVRGESPARDAASLRARGRVDPGDARAVLLCDPAVSHHGPNLAPGVFAARALGDGRAFYTRCSTPSRTSSTINPATVISSTSARR